jgi:hypothetical protein
MNWQVSNKLAVEYRHLKDENKEIQEEILETRFVVHDEDRTAYFANASVYHFSHITW